MIHSFFFKKKIGSSSSNSEKKQKKRKRKDTSDQSSKKNSSKNVNIVTNDELDSIIETEISCITDLEMLIDKYLVENFQDLRKKFIFYCPNENINKSILLFEQAFIIICKCKIIISIWKSMQLVTKIYEYTSFDFEFVNYFKLNYCKKKIQNYSMNELICTLNNLAENWKHLYFTKDIIIYLELLFTRCAFLCCFAYNNKIHDVLRFRRKISGGNNNKSKEKNQIMVEEKDDGTFLYISNEDFIIEMV